MKKKYIITGLIITLLLISGICYSCSYHSEDSAELVSLNSNKNVNQEIQPTTITEPMMQTETGMNTPIVAPIQTLVEELPDIYVHICGAVMTPGVYQAKTGARLVDLIKLAGGLTKEAAGDYINQAELVSDGQRIYIPNRKELKELSTEELMAGVHSNNEISSTSNEETTTVTTEDSALININTANAEELMKISGVGTVKAASIIAYREKNGKFNAIEELMNIPGIKEGLFNQISYMIVAK